MNNTKFTYDNKFLGVQKFKGVRLFVVENKKGLPFDALALTEEEYTELTNEIINRQAKNTDTIEIQSAGDSGRKLILVYYKESKKYLPTFIDYDSNIQRTCELIELEDLYKEC